MIAADRSLEASAPQPLAPVQLTSNPYVGPRPFEKDEDHLFFGRDREARDLISLIIANRVFVLYSQSGAGKSSLLNTKVTTGLEKEQCWVLPTARVQGKVEKSVSEAEIRNIFSLNAILSLHDAFPGLNVQGHSTATIAEFIASVYETRADHNEPIVLIFDQFEELFSFYEYRWPERTAFIREVVDALEKISELNVVFSLREDYIAKLDAYVGHFPNGLRARYHLERLREGSATEAVAGPVERSGRRYDKGVAQAIVQDLLEMHSRDIQGNQVTVTGEFVEPVQLQVVCSNLWDSIPASENLITKSHLEKSGSVDRALRKFYEASLMNVALEMHVSELEMRRWFDNALITPAGTRGTVFRDTETTAGMPNAVVDSLVNRHLIRGDWRAGAQWYEITHDRLLRPIRESNRLRLQGVTKRRRLVVGGVFAVLASVALIAFSWGEKASRRAETLALATSLVNASSKLPPNDLDLALLLAVEAFRTEDSTSTRSNLLSQVLRGDQIEHFARITTQNLASSVVIPGTELVASVTSDRSLLVWNRRGVVLSTIYLGSDYDLSGENPINLFADGWRIFAIPRQGDPQAFDLHQLGNGERLIARRASGELVDKLRSALMDAAVPAPVGLSGSDLRSQRDPEIRRTVALAAGRLLIARERELIVTDASNGSEITTFQIADEDPTRRIKVIDVGLSPDGKFGFALACGLDDARVDKANKTPSQRRAPISVNSCARGIMKFWQVDKSREIHISRSRADTPQLIAIGSSNGLIWTAFGNSDGSVVVAGHEIGEQGETSLIFDTALPAANPLQDLLFSETSNSLMTISGNGLVISWKLNEPRRLEWKLRDGLPSDIAISRSGLLASVGPAGYSVVSPDGQLAISGAIPQPSNYPGDGWVLSYGVSLATNANQLLVTQYGVIELWDTRLKQRLGSINISPAGTFSVALDPLGRYIASGWSIRRRDNATDFSRVPVLWTTDNQQPALFLDLTRDMPTPENKAAGQSSSGNDKPPNDNSDERFFVWGVGFSPDAQYFAVTHGNGWSGSVNVYRRNDSRSSGAAFGDPVVIPVDSMPHFVTFSQDGKLLAVSQSNGEIILIDAQTERQIGKIPSVGREAERIAISSDGKLLAVVNSGGLQSPVIRLWDIASRTQFGAPIQVGGISWTGVVFSADAQRLITGNANLNSMVAFDLNVESWIEQACNIAGRTLSEIERVNYKLPVQGQRVCALQGK